MMGLDGGRLNIAACSLGAAQTALDATLQYMGERKAFGKSIDQFQGLQFRLADMEIEMQAARVFLRQAAWKLDNNAPDATKFCAMASLSLTPAPKLSTNVCNYMADMATLLIMALKNWSEICVYIRYWKAQTRSCASLSLETC